MRERIRSILDALTAAKAAGNVEGLLGLAVPVGDLADECAAVDDERGVDALDYVGGALRYLRRAVAFDGDVAKGLHEVGKAVWDARIGLIDEDEDQDDEDVPAAEEAEPVRASVPGAWPNGEPQTVRDAADEFLNTLP